MNKFDDTIEEVRRHLKLDYRLSIFDVRVEEQGGRLCILGATTVPGAVDELVERLRQVKDRKYIRDEVQRLPEAGARGEWHVLVRAAVAPVYGDPALPAPQNTQAVLGTRLDLLNRVDHWCRVRLEDGYIGWVHQGYLQFGDEDWAFAWERAARGEPAVSLGAEMVDDAGRVFARLPWGARCVRFSQEQYELPDGRRGGIGAGEVVAIDRLADWFPPRGDSVTRTARRWIGAPYLWGGVTTGGVDCSGLVQAVFWLHGVALPRDSDQQSHMGDEIDPGGDFNDLNPGDLLFFSETPARVSHVAISLGGPHIVHSALSNGGVEVNNLAGDLEYEARLRSLYTRTRRVLPD
ncbi:MAG TPA: NlpC/P60 family protein [Longimicrobiales bacterium]